MSNAANHQLALGPKNETADPSTFSGASECVRPENEGLPTEQLAPGPVGKATPVTSRCVESYLVRLTIGKSLHDKLRHAQVLLSHSVPSGDVAQVLERALDSLIARLERGKNGSGVRGKSESRRSSPRLSSTGSRHILAEVRRAVWKRDQAQCTFVGTEGHRCGEKRFLELDHVEPHARGSEATVDNLRLRCRAHNQLEAERIRRSHDPVLPSVPTVRRSD
jgi:hypothetical protein